MWRATSPEFLKQYYAHYFRCMRPACHQVREAYHYRDRRRLNPTMKTINNISGTTARSFSTVAIRLATLTTKFHTRGTDAHPCPTSYVATSLEYVTELCARCSCSGESCRKWCVIAASCCLTFLIGLCSLHCRRALGQGISPSRNQLRTESAMVGAQRAVQPPPSANGRVWSRMKMPSLAEMPSRDMRTKVV
jgi:hypothetical protein